MKAAIITLALSNNYGAVLQTYALAKKTQDLGVDTVVYKYNDMRRLTHGCSLSKKIIRLAWHYGREAFSLWMKGLSFYIFRKKFLPLTDKRYHNNEQLKTAPKNYDIYISGSDQIWNPDLILYDTSYFFDFLPDDCKRISYASSFGKSTFNESHKEKCGALLSKYSNIAVREESGIQIVKDLCGKDAECVLDPTLLLESSEWDKIANNAKSKAKNFKGILCYIMPGDTKVVASIVKIAKDLQKKTNLPIKYIGIKEYNMFKYGVKNCDIFASPMDFVAYFKNAEYIVTNSFHGTAFSLIYNKKFYIPINDELNKGEALHERILSVTKKLEAENALVSTSNLELKELDLEKIQNKLSVERKKSLSFLKDSLGV